MMNRRKQKKKINISVNTIGVKDFRQIKRLKNNKIGQKNEINEKLKRKKLFRIHSVSFL